MKHSYFRKLAILIIVNLLFLCGNSAFSQTITTFPYFQDFESGSGSWTSGGTASSWAYGTPAASVINSAFSGTNVWTTNLTGNYNSSELSWVESPLFNFSTLSNPVIEFKMWYELQTPYLDGVCLQYSINGGTTWSWVGQEFGSLSLDPNGTNWYNDVSIAGMNYSNGWSGFSGGWITAKYKLYDITGYGTNLANQSSVKFRFYLGSNTSTVFNGFAFDNVSIYQAPNNDAGVSSIYSLEQICAGSNDVYVVVGNYGALAMNTVTINWAVNGTAQTPLAYTTAIPVGELDTVYLGSYSFATGTVYTVSVFTTLPNGIADEVPANDGLTLTGLETSIGGTYTIGTGGDYADFSSAISDLQTFGICSPVVLNILPGVYTTQVNLPYISGANSTNTITFTSSTGIAADVVIQYAATGTANNWVVKFEACEYFIIDNITVKSIGTSTYGIVVLLDSSDHNTVQNCIIESLDNTSTYSMGISASTGYPKYCNYLNNNIKYGYYGIYTYGNLSNYGAGTVVSGNHITDYYYYGIYIYYQSDVTVTNNYVQNGNTNGTTKYGIRAYYVDGESDISGNEIDINASSTAYGMYSYYISGLTKITNNNVKVNGGSTSYGIYARASGTTTNPILYANNSIIQEGSGTTIYGMYIYYCDQVDIIYNSINILGESSTGRAAYISAPSTGYAGVRMLNNNVVNSGLGVTFEMTATALAGGVVELSDHNNLYTNGANLCNLGGTYVSDLAGLQAAGSDSNSVSVLPVFAGMYDLHTYSASLNGLATPVASVTLDIDGEPRDALNPDIGFDEFTPAMNDAAVSSLPGINAVCAGSIDVIATISNYGLATLNTVTVNWEVNGVVQTPVSLAAMGLASGTSADYTLGNFTFLNGVSYDISAWTNSPNGSADAHPENDSLNVVGMMTSASGIYTIGTTGDFLTINDAVTFINNSGVCGPTVFNIQTGTYDEQVTIGNVPGSSSVNTITFQSQSGVNSDVIVQYSAVGSTDNWVWKLNGSNYITVQNITIKSTGGATYGRVVELAGGCSYNVINGNYLEAPVNVSSSTAVVYNYNTVDNYNTISNNYIKNGYYGIYFYGGSSTSLESGSVISNNIIEDFYYYGIYSYGQDAPVISGNQLTSRAGSTTNYGIYCSYNDNALNVSGNKVYLQGTSTTYGIYIYYSDGTSTDPGLIYNNFVSESGSTGTVYGLDVYYSSYKNVYYNTVTVTGGSATAGRDADFAASTGTGYGNINVVNNIFVNSGGGYAFEITQVSFDNNYITNQDFNDYYATGSTTMRIGTANYASLALFQLIGLELNSLSVDPAFPGLTDLHLNSADLNGAATPLTAVTDDIDGDLRNATTPDIGADEFNLVTEDAGVISIIGLDAVCPGSADIIAEVYNFGLGDITTLTLNWSVNGVTQTPFSYTGLIASATSVTMTIGSYTFAANTPYDVSVWSSNPNGSPDGNTANDQWDYLGMQTAIFGTYSIGATGDFTTVNDAATFISTYGICGPVIFNIESGTYTEQVTINPIPGTSAVNTVTFQSVTGNNNDVIVEYAAAGSGDNWVWMFNGGDYVTVQNMTIRSTTTTTYGYVMVFQGISDHNNILNNKIHTIVSTSSYTLGIRSYTDSQDQFNLIEGNEISGGYYGIYWYGLSSALEEGNQFVNNTVTDFYYYGLYNAYQYANTVSGNYVQQSVSGGSTTCYPFYIYYCDGPIVVTNNQLYDNGGTTWYGFRIYYCDASSTDPGLVANNMISSEGNTGTVYGLYMYYSTYQKVYHNSVYLAAGQGTTYGAYLYGAGPYDFKNNSIVNMDNSYCLYGTSTTTPGLTSDHNNLYSNGTTLCSFTTAYATLADWQAIHPGDVVSNTGAYNSITDLHSLSAALNNHGTYVAEVPLDFDGETRSTTAPDIGCDEFSIPANDVEVFDLVYNYGEVPIEGGGDVVIAFVRNIGLNDQPNFPVTLSVTGANTFTSTIIIPMLLSGETDTVYFDPFTPSTTGWNTLTVSIPNDDVNTNNTASSYNQATQNAFAYADTSGSDGNGGQNGGRIYQTRYYMDGVHQVAEIEVFITDDPNNAGNSVYGVVLDENHNIVQNGDTLVLDTTMYNTWVTLTFPSPQLNVVANNYFVAGFAQIPPVGGNYLPIGYQDEIPMRWGAYFYSLLDGSSLIEFDNDRRWMIRAITADPDPFDAACIGFTAPIGGCGLTTQEPVTIQILNFGTDTINGNLTATYQLDANTPVTEPVTAVIPPGVIFDFTFATGANLFAPFDTAFSLIAWVDHTFDTNAANDTSAVFDFESMYVPVAPVGYNDTVNYGGQALLTATAVDSMFWFDDNTAGANYIALGSSYLTPMLFDTTTYWVSAFSGAESNGTLTTTFVGGNGSTGNMFDITAVNELTIDSFDINGAGSTAMEVWYRPGSYVGYQSSNAGWTLAGSYTVTSSGQYNPTRLPIGGITIPAGATYGIYVTYVSGTLTYTNGNGSNEVYSNPDMTIQCGVGGSYFAVTIASRVWNGNIYYTVGAPGCSSALVPVTAVVQNIPPYDAGVLYENSPVSAAELTMETVSVDIKNWGSQPISGFSITYEIDNGASATEFVSNITLQPGDVYTYVFTTLANLSAYGPYEFTVYTSLLGDGYSPNDTIVFTVENFPLTYCTSSATSTGYEEVINVSLSNLNNYSGPAFGSMYQNFSTIAPAELTPGLTYTITVQSDYAPGYSTSYNCWVEVYIDFNHNAIYEEPSEVFMSMATSSQNTVSGTFTVPFTAATGTHGMRVVYRESGSAALNVPCGTYTWGETEDYVVHVSEPVPIDAGATAFLQPSTTTLVEGSSVPVEVIVFNFGTDVLTSMDVVYTIDGLNPVVFAYTGSLTHLQSDTILFPNMTVPGGYFDLCAYTVLTGDTVTINDMVCATYYGEPQYDLGIVSIDGPEGGCNLGFEDVTITFENIGDTVFGGVVASFFTDGMTAAVNETYNDTVLPNEVVTYTFTTPIDLAVAIDTEFEIFAWINYAFDPVGQNDTTSIIVLSGTSPTLPVANDMTIWSGEFTTLSVINPDTNFVYTWYAPDTTVLVADSFYITPALFDTTTYFLTAASGGAASLAITEIGLGGSDYIEIQNLSNSVVDATGWVVILSNSYTDINSVNTIYWNLGTMQAGQVLYKSDSSADNYWGNNILWNPGGPTTYRGWAMIIDNNGDVVDFINFGWTPTELLSFNITINGNPIDISAEWDGSYVTPLTSDYIVRVEYDTNTPADWINSSVGSIGSANPNMLISGGSGSGCQTPLVPVTVYTQYAAYDGALASIVSPVTGAYMGVESVVVDIYNNGTADLTGFSVSYTLDGGISVTEIVNTTVTPGMTYTHTFAIPVDISVYGSYDLCAYVTVANDGYTLNDNICNIVTNMNGDGISCASAFPYIHINDPMVFGATLIANDNEWWKFELPLAADNVSVSLCGSSYDTKLDIYDQCGTSTILATNNDYAGCGTSSQIDFTTLAAGTYWVKVSGISGSFGDYQLEITGTYVPVIQVNATITNIPCYGLATGSIITTSTPLTGSTPPFTYIWSNGETTQSITNLTAGQYCLTVSDAAGYELVICYDITQPDELIATVVATDATALGMGNGSVDGTITGGTTPYSIHWSNNVNNVQDQTSLYAGVYYMTVTDGNLCEAFAVDTVNTLPPPVGWAVTPTAITHEIMIPQNATITLDGSPLAPGSFVGVFYNQGGNLVCGGWAYWSGMETSVIAYGSAPGQNNGFAPGELFTWKVYDVGLNVMFGGSPTYSTQYPNGGNFVINGLSGITNLPALSIVTQTVNVPQGWCIWSTYINPVYPNIADILAPITAPIYTQGPVEIVKNGLGQIFWPQYGINFIGNIVIGQGYQMKVNFAPTSFGVTGLLVAPELTPLTYNTGWSIIGYIRTTPANIATMLSPIVGCVEIVKNDIGQIYWPLYGINFIVNMMPGEGYQLKMNCSQTFNYPPNTASVSKSDVIDFNTPVNYDNVKNTGNNMSLGILNTAWNIKPETGDEIGVFNSDGKLIGSSVYENDFTAITIWGDEVLGETKDVQGDFYTLKLWQYATGKEDVITVDKWNQGNGQFETNAIHIIEKLTIKGSDNEYALYQNVPNPFRSTTEITFNVPEDCNVTLTVYNTLGGKVKEIANGWYKAGKYTVEFEAGSLPAGTYFYKILTARFVATNSMNLNR